MTDFLSHLESQLGDAVAAGRHTRRRASPVLAGAGAVAASVIVAAVVLGFALTAGNRSARHDRPAPSGPAASTPTRPQTTITVPRTATSPPIQSHVGNGVYTAPAPSSPRNGHQAAPPTGNGVQPLPNSPVTPLVPAGRPTFVGGGSLTAPGGGGAPIGGYELYRTAGVGVTLKLGLQKMAAPAKGERYALWLTDGARPKLLGYLRPPGPHGKIDAEGALPASAQSFHRIEVTLERPAPPVLRGGGALITVLTHPGKVVLSGALRR